MGLARYDLDRQSVSLVGGNPYRFVSLLQASRESPVNVNLKYALALNMLYLVLSL